LSIKSLAGQTIYYGFSNIATKLLSYFLTPLYLELMTQAAYGEMSTTFAYVPFMNIILTYGMETAFFRFAKQENRQAVLGTSTISLLLSTLVISIVLLLFSTTVTNSYVGELGGLKGHPGFYMVVVLIMAFDTLTTIPFAQLRLENRPVKYAMIRISNILVTIGFNIFFLVIVPKLHANGWNWLPVVNKDNQVGYIFFSTMMGSAATLILFLPQLLKIKWVFDGKLWREMINYAMPLIIVGLAGMVNEVFDRAWFLPAFLPGNDLEQKKELIGIYAANYKLAILITMFIQAFKLGAEPFFFKQAQGADPQKSYARIMKLFVALLCCMFLFVSLYLNIWKIFLRKPAYYEGMRIVPVLLLANMFLGIYYNLTIWFKLTDRTRTGAVITVITAVCAFLFNWWWIPRMGYFGAALATMVCYFIQMSICYALGQKYYPVPYHLPRIITYMVTAVLIYYLYEVLNRSFISPTDIYALKPLSLTLATVLFGAYIWFILKMEKKEFSRLPFIGKYVSLI
jgi:O-antigen/teichoic acid export membrane protein